MQIRWLYTLALSTVFLCLGVYGQSGQPRLPDSFMKSEKGHGHLDVPFRIVHGLIVTELRINHGQPTPFIFDTGSSGTLIDQEAARALGVKITSRRGPNIAGSGQCTYLPSFATKKIEIDSDKTEILHGELAAADLSGLRRLVPGLVGIIGYNLSRQHPFIFD